MRIARTMARVADLERLLEVYARPDGHDAVSAGRLSRGRFTLAGVGGRAEEDSATIELTWN